MAESTARTAGAFPVLGWDPDPTDTWTLTEYALLLREKDGTLHRPVQPRCLAASSHRGDDEDLTPRELFRNRRPVH
jgi:hypothetical protein